MLLLTTARNLWIAGSISWLYLPSLPAERHVRAHDQYEDVYPYQNQMQPPMDADGLQMPVRTGILTNSGSPDTGEDLTVQQKIQKASELLHSVGLTDLCHISSDAFYPSFPRCDDLTVPIAVPSLVSKGSNLRSLSTSESRGGGRGLHQGLNRRTAMEESEESTEPRDTNFYIYNGLMAFICVATAALAAGLTLGLLSLDPLNLLIKMRTASSEEEKRQAASLLPIVRQHHMLLVTLLLLNSMANEALPLFLDKIVPGYLAIILSVTLCLFFGEIIPAAIFTGPQRIKIASQLAPLVRFVMCALYPIAFPISKLLDTLLHDEEDDGGAFSRGELSALVRIQYEERLAAKKRRKEEKMLAARNFSGTMDDSMNKSVRFAGAYGATHSLRLTKRELFQNSLEPPLGMNSSLTSSAGNRPALSRTPSLHCDEVTMIQGALNMKTKLALDVYTPMRDVFAVPFDTILTEQKIVEIYSSGYSRVPVYKKRLDKQKDKSGVLGVLLTKQLIVVSTSDERPVSTLPLQVPYCVSPTMNLIDLINLFQTPSSGNKGGHMAIVCARPHVAEQALELGEHIPEKAGTMGLVTLEDCLEELLQEEIYDETDQHEIAQMRVTRWAWRKWKLFVKKRKLEREQMAIAVSNQPALLGVVETALNAAETGEGSSLLPGGRSLERLDAKSKPFFGLF